MRFDYNDVGASAQEYGRRFIPVRDDLDISSTFQIIIGIGSRCSVKTNDVGICQKEYKASNNPNQ